MDADALTRHRRLARPGVFLAALLLCAAPVRSQEAAVGQSLTRAAEWLRTSAGAGGGFGYRSGGMPFTAPTALALAALEGAGEAAEGARGWLLRTQIPGGGWPACEVDPDASWMTAIAVLALATDETAAQAVREGRRWLLEDSLPRRGSGRAAHGWPWVPGTSPWVEPTAWSLFALSRSGGGGGRRVHDAVRYLAEETGREGGWSLYDARPYPYHTGLVLLALQGEGLPASTRARQGAITYLAESLEPGATELDLIWGLWGLAESRARGVDLAALAGRLEALQQPDGSFSSSPWRTAAAILALRAAGRSRLNASFEEETDGGR